ncbi:hypothetical protein, partial [Pontiella sp.]|uniref:hypothetical protein n=1 Tax=Pontiella sp. TaxID=2837462 RepID=UPI003565BE40
GPAILRRDRQDAGPTFHATAETHREMEAEKRGGRKISVRPQEGRFDCAEGARCSMTRGLVPAVFQRFLLPWITGPSSLRLGGQKRLLRKHPAYSTVDK